MGDEEKKFQQSLVELAEKYQREVAYFLFQNYDPASKDEHEMKDFFGHAIQFIQLMTDFRRTKKVDKEKVDLIRTQLNDIREDVAKTEEENSKGIVIARELNYCIGEIWKTVAVFCEDEKEKENLRKLLDITLQFMRLEGLPLSVFSFLQARISPFRWELCRNANIL